MNSITEAEREAIAKAHFSGLNVDGHTALSELLGISRNDAKLLFYKFVYSDPWLKKVWIKPHQELWTAIHKLYKAKGRYHTEQATVNLFDVAGMDKVK